MKSSLSRAFTLIELLVVIAIIAILAAILFPVFAQAKDAAKKSVGLSNVKQIDTGYLLYLGDYDDRYPFSVTERVEPHYPTTTQAQAAVYSIRFNLNPYTKSDQIWKDPSAPTWPTPGPKQWYTVDYGSNFNDAHYVGNSGVPYAPAYAATTGTVTIGGNSVQALNDFGFNEDVTQTSVASPANFLIIADGARADGAASRGGLYPQPWAFDDSAGFTDASDNITPSTHTTQSRLYPRHGDRVISVGAAGASPSGFSGLWIKHSGGVNIGYGDGHAKWKKIEATWRSYNDNDWRRNPTTP